MLIHNLFKLRSQGSCFKRDIWIWEIDTSINFEFSQTQVKILEMMLPSEAAVSKALNFSEFKFFYF